jgi:hypothetical protein
MGVQSLVNTAKTLPRRIYEFTYHKAKKIAGVCDSPSLENVRDLLEHAEQITNRAKTTAEFANYTQVLGKAGEDLGGAANAVDKLVKQGNKVTGDVSAACEISDAVKDLMDWGEPGSKTSSKDAAKAFDKLFGGASRYMGKLPFPASSYADILSAIGKNNFFSNMQNIMDPESPDTPRGRMMREAMKQQ